MGMKLLGEGPTRLLPPPSSSSSPRGFDLESTGELWVDPDDDGSTQGDDPVQGVRTAMLRHQHVFRTQLFELHRLYWTQNSLMNGFSYDHQHQAANHNGVAFDWAAVRQTPMASAAGKANATAQERSSISSQQTPLNFVPGWNVDGPHGFNSKLPQQQEWLTASEFQFFHDCHSARAPETRCFQPQQPLLNRSAAWSAVAVKPEPVDLTFATANGSSSNHNVDRRRTLWGRFPGSKPQASLTGPKEVINLDSSSSDSEQVNREEGEGGAAPPPPASSCFRTPPVCSSGVGRQECRLPKLFDMNHMCEEETMDHYDTGHSVNIQPGLNETSNCKPGKAVLFDLNTIQDEDSSAVIQEAENNVSSSSAGSSVIVHGVANDGCASMPNFHLGFSNMRSVEGSVSVKIEAETLNSDLRNLEGKRTEILSNESDNARSSLVAGSSGVWNCNMSDANQVVLCVPASKCLLELNSLPDDDDGMDEMLVPSSNGSSSVSQSKPLCSSNGYPSNLVDLVSDSRVTGYVTECLPGGSHQPSLESTNLPLAVGRDTGKIAQRVEGERSEEDTVSSRMHIISNSSQVDRPNSSPKQKQGGQLEACAFRNGPQGDDGKLTNLFRREGDALISDTDGQAIQQRLKPGRGISVEAQQHAVVGIGESVSPVRSCYSGSPRPEGDDKIHYSKHQDMDKDLMILTAAETLAHILNTRGASCTRRFPDAVHHPQEVGEEMECDAQPECSCDSLELIVLALPENQEDEGSSPANDSNNLSVGTVTTTENSSGFRFNTRRGRQLRDFQKDILPGIISLSRHEICEDMHAFTEIVKFEELKRKGGRPGRWATNRGVRGSVARKKRSRTSAYVQRR